jgi:hypothetical protein
MVVYNAGRASYTLRERFSLAAAHTKCGDAFPPPPQLLSATRGAVSG